MNQQAVDPGRPPGLLPRRARMYRKITGEAPSDDRRCFIEA
ncbi:MAG: hypothetical protein ACLFV7_07995 [Phycisphaerae bacterium]